MRRDADRRSGPRVLRVPGLGADQQVGLGSMIARATAAMGVPACGGCKQRAEALDRRVVLRGRGAPGSRTIRPPQ